MNGCKPVYPWNFVRTNTIFGVIHAAGGYTAWSDKHPAYSSVSGPGATAEQRGRLLQPRDQLDVVALAGRHDARRHRLQQVPDPTSDMTAWTNSFQNIQCYDTMKVERNRQ